MWDLLGSRQAFVILEKAGPEGKESGGQRERAPPDIFTQAEPHEALQSASLENKATSPNSILASSPSWQGGGRRRRGGRMRPQADMRFRAP